MQQQALEAVAREGDGRAGRQVDYKFGTMIEIPRAALTADQIAEYAQFFSFGTNDLTQTTYGISRDDAEKGFLMKYVEKGILPENPFASHRRGRRGQADGDGRRARPQGAPGHGDRHLRRARRRPEVDRLLPPLGLNYVSCSPFRVPIARLAAAQAALREKGVTAK